MDTAGPAEIDARIRIVIGKDAINQLAKNPSLKEIRSGEISIDEDSYTAKIKQCNKWQIIVNYSLNKRILTGLIQTTYCSKLIKFILIYSKTQVFKD